MLFIDYLYFFVDLLLYYIETSAIIQSPKGSEQMAFSYDKLWKLLIDKKKND